MGRRTGQPDLYAIPKDVRSVRGIAAEVGR